MLHINNASSSSVVVVTSKHKLPIIELLKFDGDPEIGLRLDTI